MKVQYYTSTHFSRSAKNRVSSLVRDTQQPLSVWLLRPYLDLGGCGGSIQSRIVIYMSECLNRETEPSPFVQINTLSTLRDSLIRESGLTHYDVVLPEELAVQFRTPSWQLLCEQLANWQSLRNEQKLKVVTLLSKLGLYRAVLSYVPAISEDEITSDESMANIAMKRANALFKTEPQNYLSEVERLCSLVATSAPGDGRTRLKAAVNLVVHYARLKNNMQEMEYWAEVAKKYFHVLQPDKNPIDHLYISYYYRGVSFVPYYSGNKSEVVRMLDEAEEHARAAFQVPDVSEIIAAENLHPLLETRAREAIWIGNFDLALARLQNLVAHDQLEPKVHIRLGDFFYRQQQIENALLAYRQAARLGAPYTPLAWFRVGECYRELGVLDKACDAYLQSLKAEPWGVSATLKLYQIAKQLNQRLLWTWSEERLQHFRQLSQSKEDSSF